MLICPSCGYRVRCCATDCPNCATPLELDEAQPALTCDPREEASMIEDDSPAMPPLSRTRHTGRIVRVIDRTQPTMDELYPPHNAATWRDADMR